MPQQTTRYFLISWHSSEPLIRTGTSHRLSSQLRSVLYELLFTGKPIPYVPQNPYIDAAQMFGFIKNDNGTAAISNRIFESVLYNLFISEEFSTNKLYDAGVMDRNQFITGGHLNVRRILEKFVSSLTGGGTVHYRIKDMAGQCL